MNTDLNSEKDLSEEDIKNRFITPALNKAGWENDSFRMEAFTDGRIIVQGKQKFRRKGKRADYVLFAGRNLPIAVIEAKKADLSPSAGISQAIEYAQMLDVHFAFSSNGSAFRFHNLETGEETELSMDEFPSPEKLLSLHRGIHNLSNEEQRIVDEPYYYNIGTHDPRYYQRIAINRTVEAVAKGRKRLLLVMATGTGKTYTAFQIIHRLHASGKCKKILYLADRNNLIDQTIQQDFAPFKKILTKVKHKEADSSFEIYMSLYGQWVDEEATKQPYEDFAKDFFDLIVVDECHRGSVREDSEWRKILEYFSPAIQLGLTATPKAVDGANNIDYFCTENDGKPIYIYSIDQGIDDGFLAPYRVTRSFLSIDLEGWIPEPGEKDLYDNLIEQRHFARTDMGRKLAVETRRAVVARRINAKLRELGRMTKTIIFCPDQDEAQAMRDLLVELNQDMVRVDPRYVMRITSDDKIGKQQLDNFIDADEKYPTIVTTSELLTTGADCKTVGLLVFDKEVSSMTSFKQMVGRGTRVNEKHGKLSFEILDFRNVCSKFNDPGYISIVDTEGKVKKNKGGDDDPPPPIEPPVDPPSGPRKYRIRGKEVTISHEIIQFLGADGKLKTESIRDYTKKAIKGRYATMHDFLKRWNDAERKQVIVEELKNSEEPVMIEAVLEANPTLADKDLFDIILHVAFDQKPLTRKERAENVKKRNYLAKYEGKAREVLSALLDKYQDRGILELENDEIFEIPPFNLMGSPKKIVSFFGGAAAYDKAIHELEDELYKDAV